MSRAKLIRRDFQTLESTSSLPRVFRETSLPTFVVLGAMKAGTTSLHYYLEQHPDISMSHPKELNFFLAEQDDPSAGHRPDWNFYRGVDWYAQHFDAAATARGDVSPAYSNPIFSGVAGRMRSVIPDAQLIFITRDPLARTVSHYQHDVARGRQSAPFAEVVKDVESWYVQLSLYHKAMQPFLREFGDGRIIHYRQEDLDSRPEELLRDLFSRIGVRNDLPLEHTKTRLNIAGTWYRNPQESDRNSASKLVRSAALRARSRRSLNALSQRPSLSTNRVSLNLSKIDMTEFRELVKTDQELFRQDLESGRIVNGLAPCIS